jgi:hypothetical protein
MADMVFIVQAWHYAQWEATEHNEAGEIVGTEIGDEDDCNMVLVGVRGSLEEARKLARKYHDEQVVRENDEVMDDPICSINVWKAPMDDPPGSGEYVETVLQSVEYFRQGPVK